MTNFSITKCGEISFMNNSEAQFGFEVMAERQCKIHMLTTFSKHYQEVLYGKK